MHPTREHQTREQETRDLLYNRKHAMTKDMTVAQYIANFRGYLSYVPDMAEADRIRFFHSGLTPHYQLELVTDKLTGKPFTTLEAMTTAALAAARALALTNMNRAAVNALHVPQSRSSTPSFKKQRTDSGSVPRGSNKANDDAGPSGGVRKGKASRPTSGGGRSNAPSSGPPRALNLSGIHALDGRRLTFAELAHYKGHCYNCFKPGHNSKNCRGPKKPYEDGWVDEQGKVHPYSEGPRPKKA